MPGIYFPSPRRRSSRVFWYVVTPIFAFWTIAALLLATRADAAKTGPYQVFQGNIKGYKDNGAVPQGHGWTATMRYVYEIDAHNGQNGYGPMYAASVNELCQTMFNTLATSLAPEGVRGYFVYSHDTQDSDCGLYGNAIFMKQTSNASEYTNFCRFSGTGCGTYTDFVHYERRLAAWSRTKGVTRPIWGLSTHLVNDDVTLSSQQSTVVVTNYRGWTGGGARVAMGDFNQQNDAAIKKWRNEYVEGLDDDLDTMTSFGTSHIDYIWPDRAHSKMNQGDYDRGNLDGSDHYFVTNKMYLK